MSVNVDNRLLYFLFIPILIIFMIFKTVQVRQNKQYENVAIVEHFLYIYLKQESNQQLSSGLVFQDFRADHARLAALS